VSRQLAWLVASGDLPPGDQLPPLRELATQLGINLHTVRAAYQQLAAEGLVSTRQGQRATVLPYDRARVASATPNLPSFTLGVVIPGFAPFYAPLLEGIEAAAAKHPALVFICNAHEKPASFLNYVDRLISRQVDGIILASPELPPNTVLPPAGQGPPIVFVDHPGSPRPGVEFNLEDSSFQATRHLVEHGHQRIDFPTPPVEWPNVTPKLVGFRHALELAGLDPLVATVVPDFSIDSGRQGTIHLLDQDQPPTGIVAASDELALGAMYAITSRGLRIPEDVALVGNDDINMAAVIRPALTTVSLPVREAGVQAVTMLPQLIVGDTPEPSRLVLGVDLVVRESCGCAHQEGLDLP
jgi:DNA-binding LacI/PurR family transcriptional regulator